MLEHRRIILGVTGSIACYKAADLASKLTQAGALVDVILTDAAQQFISPLTFRAITQRDVYTNIRQISNSCGSRTSTMSGAVPPSMRAFNSSGVISTASSLWVAATGAGGVMPQNWS